MNVNVQSCVEHLKVPQYSASDIFDIFNCEPSSLSVFEESHFLYGCGVYSYRLVSRKYSVMASNVKFNISLNLQEQSSISTAIHIWDKAPVKAKAIRFFLENSVFEDNVYHPDQRWCEITKFALKELDKMELSEQMSKDIADRIDVIGKKIYHWGKHMIEGAEIFELDLLRKIHWTVYGTIDESKTFQSVELRSYDPPVTAFRYACLFVQKDFIKQNLNKMIFWIRSLFAPFQLKNSEYTPYTIIAMYVCSCFGDKTIGGGKVYKNLRKLKSPNYELFRICLTLGFIKAAKYFYSKLKTEEKQRILIEAAQECVMVQQKYHLGDYRREKIAELVVFLINNMTYADKITFMTKNLTDIFKLFMFLWPYQNLCLPMLDFIWPNLTEVDHESILDLNLVCLIKDSVSRYYVNKRLHQEILKKLLEKISDNMVFNKFCGEKCWLQLFKLCDFATLRIIISHTNLYQVRNTFIEMCYEDLKKYIADGKFEIVDSYLSLLLLSDTEKDKFKRDFNLLPDFIDNGQLELADKFLDWRCGSDEEKAILKKGINPHLILNKFAAEKKDNVANSFVNWYFNFTQEKNHVKETINKSLCNGFLTVWGKACACGSDFAKDKCLEFLNSFLKSENEINLFKEEAFEKNEEFVKMFCDRLGFVEAFDTVNDLFKFCLIKPENIQEIKRKIVDNIDWYIDTYGIKANNFLIVNALVNWAVRDDAQKKNIIEAFVNSKKGPVLCVVTLNNCKYDKETPVLKLFNTWIKPYGNIPKIKEQLRLIKNGDITEKGVSGVLKLLDKLEQDGVVTSSNISCIGFNYVKESFSLPKPLVNGFK